MYEGYNEDIYDGSGLADDAVPSTSLQEESSDDEKMIYETVAGEVKFTLQYVQPDSVINIYRFKC